MRVIANKEVVGISETETTDGYNANSTSTSTSTSTTKCMSLTFADGKYLSRASACCTHETVMAILSRTFSPCGDKLYPQI